MVFFQVAAVGAIVHEIFGHDHCPPGPRDDVCLICITVSPTVAEIPVVLDTLPAPDEPGETLLPLRLIPASRFTEAPATGRSPPALV